MSGSGTSWAICKSAPSSRQITTPVPHNSAESVSYKSMKSSGWFSLIVSLLQAPFVFTLLWHCWLDTGKGMWPAKAQSYPKAVLLGNMPKLIEEGKEKELRERLGVEDIALILQQNRLRWTWKEVVWEGCQARKLNKEDAMDRCKWRKVTKEVRWPGWVWAGECYFWYRPTRVVLDKRPLNFCCCCYCAVLVWVRPDSESVADVKGAWCLLLPVA